MQGSGTGGRQGAAEGPGGQGGAAPAGGQYTANNFPFVFSQKRFSQASHF